MLSRDWRRLHSRRRPNYGLRAAPSSLKGGAVPTVNSVGRLSAANAFLRDLRTLHETCRTCGLACVLGRSLAPCVLLVIDQPLQYFFALNYTYNATKPAPKTYVQLDDFEGGKYVVFPLAKNEILVRFENLQDKFDLNTTVLNVDI